MEEQAGYFDGWKITEEQKHLINRRDGSAESKAAFDLFFKENYKRIFFLAKKVLYQTFRIEVKSYSKTFATYGQKEIDAEYYDLFSKKIICRRVIVTQNNLIEVSDLLNSLYADYLGGYIVFKLEPRYIAGVLCHSFRYAAVGGLEGVQEYKPRRTARTCQKQVNCITYGSGT